MKKVLAYILFCLAFGKPKAKPWPEGIKFSELKRILVVRNDNIGDLICSLPVFEALKKTFPQAEITLAASTYNAEIARGNPYIDKILCYEKYKHSMTKWHFWSAWNQYRFLRALRKEKFDLAIGLRSHFSRTQSLIVFASGAPYRLGHYPVRSCYRHLSFFYNVYTTAESRAEKHEVERTLDVLNVLGIKHSKPAPCIVIDQNDIDLADDIFSSRNIKGRPTIGYHISNRKPGLVWPLENFAFLIHMLKEKYPASEHLITFAPGESDRAELLTSMLKDKIHVVPTTRIKELGAIQRNCRIFITLDGAPMHLAAALGVSTLAIFGVSDPVVWRPWGTGHHWLIKKEGISAISPEEVCETAVEMLEDKVTVPCFNQN